MAETVTVTGPAPAQGQLAPGIWFVGCGNMAGAMVEGWRLAGADLSRSVAIRPSGTEVQGVRTVRSLGEAGLPPELLVLGFKPQMLADLAPGIANWVTSRTAVVSILAGVETDTLRARFPLAKAVVRAMPNIAVAVRRGVIALHGDADGALKAELQQLFGLLGMTIWCEAESELAAVGSVAGAGPAYVARFIAALADAGQARGLAPELALQVARETVFGTGWLAAATGAPMDELVRRVKSPNGTTEAGLKVLDAELPDLIERTVAAAGRRGRELAEAAKG